MSACGITTLSCCTVQVEETSCTSAEDRASAEEPGCCSSSDVPADDDSSCVDNCCMTHILIIQSIDRQAKIDKQTVNSRPPMMVLPLLNRMIDGIWQPPRR